MTKQHRRVSDSLYYICTRSCLPLRTFRRCSPSKRFNHDDFDVLTSTALNAWQRIMPSGLAVRDIATRHEQQLSWSCLHLKTSSILLNMPLTNDILPWNDPSRTPPVTSSAIGPTLSAASRVVDVVNVEKRCYHEGEAKFKGA